MSNSDSTTVTESVGAALKTIYRPVGLLDIMQAIVALGNTDAGLIAAMGGPKRVFSYYQPDAVIDSDYPAYITYAQTAYPEETDATGQPVLSLAIWGLNRTVVTLVRDRLVALLHEKPLTTSKGRVTEGTRIGERDSFQENTKFTGLTLQFRFGFSKV